VRPIEEQTILVTGATDGIGERIARDLAERGATVLVHGRSEERVAAAARVIHMSSGVASSGGVDLSDPADPSGVDPYRQSKVALMLLAREMGDRWSEDAIDVDAVSGCGRSAKRRRARADRRRRPRALSPTASRRGG